jgi:hypothetical protein
MCVCATSSKIPPDDGVTVTVATGGASEAVSHPVWPSSPSLSQILIHFTFQTALQNCNAVVVSHVHIYRHRNSRKRWEAHPTDTVSPKEHLNSIILVIRHLRILINWVELTVSSIREWHQDTIVLCHPATPTSTADSPHTYYRIGLNSESEWLK